MKNKGLVVLGMVTGILLTIAFFWNGTSGQAQAGGNHDPFLSTPSLIASSADEGDHPVSLSESNFTDLTPPPGFSADALAPSVLPTPIPGETQVFFVPTDNDATATVLYLYNTDTVAHIVALRGFSYNGVLVYSLNINVGATSFLRLASDSIASAPPPSWATPAPIITNFTDFTYYAMLSLPKGVKAEGYTLFNPGTGVVNPRADQGAIPLRFSTDPSTLFMPAVQAGP